MELPKRKPNRLKDFDYSMPNAYFITLCTAERKNLFWHAVGASIARPEDIPLTPYGKIAVTAIQNIPNCYPSITLDHYVVMPNHIHLLLQIQSDKCGRAMPAPTISTVIQQLKGVITKQVGRPIWQKLFHDHVIRNEQDYLKIWNYIDSNPAKWTEDCFYIE